MTIQLSTKAYQVVEAALIGGSIVAILKQKADRAKAIAALKIAAGIDIWNPLTDLCGIPINVISQEAYTFQSEVTKNPVENGVKMADHVILNPIKVDISFEIVNSADMDPKYLFGLLVTMWQERKLTTLLTEHAQLESMVLSSLPIANSLPHWGRLKCRATFEQINMPVFQTRTDTIQKVTLTDELGLEEINQSAVPTTSVGTAAATVLKTITAGLF
jgi:hypothetical protein